MSSLPRTLKFGLPSRMVVLFDPEELAHRRSEPKTWMRSAEALAEEVAAGRAAVFEVGQPTVELRLDAAGEPVSGPPDGATCLRVRSGRVFAGDRAQLPSRAWGRRRWNVWDYLFVAFFVVAVPAWLVWLLGFDARMLMFVAGGAVAFTLGCIPITWLVFRGGHDFARKTGIPPEDLPHQVLDLPNGEYAVRFERVGTDPLGPVVRVSLSRVGASESVVGEGRSA